jgi:2-oxoisovalerate dehydrogenase E1 component alpha subunit
MGGTMLDSLRQMGMRATDRWRVELHEPLRDPEWNVAPMAPTIETQYLIAPGTAWVQRRHGGDGITIVNGGDAGTAEGDFASCLIWSTRPGKELPMLIIVVNNKFGISTSHATQHGVRNIADRGVPHGVDEGHQRQRRLRIVVTIDEAMRYVRTERRPYLLEAHVSRLNGHSSSSGANRVDEIDCILDFEKQLLADKIRTEAGDQGDVGTLARRSQRVVKQLRTEPFPEASDIWKWTFHNDSDNALAKAS